MNYYPFHLGDYATHTAHLEPMEDLAYRRMLDLYYLREEPLPSDVSEVARLIRLRANVNEVETVLREFFTLTEQGWFSDRCHGELVRMLDKQAKAQMSAQASVAARKAKAEHRHNVITTDAQQTLNDRSTDVELPTPTPTPTPVNTNTGASAKRAKPALVKPDGVSEAVWSDFLAIRKAKRAPLTSTALDGIEREANRAGMSLADVLALCCTRGWQGFKADWVMGIKSSVAMPQATGETAYQRSMRQRVAEITPSIARREPTENPIEFFRTIDMNPVIPAIEVIK